ncbi:MAG: serine/threonine protein kinase [Lentisphaerales bacterium]|nr:serine/threonine protein kinase [Lentisphaerales bacterium]
MFFYKSGSNVETVIRNLGSEMSNSVKSYSFGTRTIRFNNRIVITAVVVLLFSIGFFTIRKIENGLHSIAKEGLEQTLNANAESLIQYLEDQKSDSNIVTKNPELVKLAESLVDYSYKNGVETIEQQSAYSDFSKRLSGLLKDLEFTDYYLINMNFTHIVTSDPSYKGRKVGVLPDELLRTLKAGKVYVSLPIFMKGEEEKLNAKPLMFTAQYIYRNNQAFAILALRLDPSEEFSRVMFKSRTGESRETYAINSDGMMISNSRFLKGLQNEGLIQEGQKSSVLKLKVQSPDGKLTVMAESALSKATKVTYPNLESNTEGYDDYRGVNVIGAWTYLADYGFAITSEIDYDEAYQSLFIIRNNFRIMLGLAVLFGLGTVVYSRKAVKMQVKFRDALKEAKELGQYVLTKKLGEGGMGVVYKATHKMMHRDTALKLLKNEACTDRDLKLFENEVQQTCKLTHPNTIRVYDYGKTDDGTFYYVMEYLEGMELNDIVKRMGPLSPERAIYFLKQICASLNEAHSIGLVHRDIKSQNVFITQQGGEYDVVKVLDFGLVREVSDTDNSMLDNVSGTPAYMSPESVVRPRDVNHSSDLYAVGILGFYILTGGYPFEGSTPVSLLMKHVNEKPPRPSEILGKPLPKDLENVIFKCLEKEQEDRPESARHLFDLLDNCEASGNWDLQKAEKWWGAKPMIKAEKKDEISTKAIDQTVQISLDS